MRCSLARPVLRSTRAKQAAQIFLSRHYATPVEYKPHEKDPQLGDYPQLPFVSTQLRPPKGWWDVQMRRDYGEVVHEEDDGLNMWTPDPPPVEPSTALRQFSITALCIAAFGYVIYVNVPERTSIPREYPYSGLVKELGGLEENKAIPEGEAEEDE
ncbi:hypothetical protein JB92DRAFT_2845425 [Gautieria morchelliformis]|nr:hypothetical protein JB92DRAFT_2845425 [Gautieria morchelliformis]